MACHHNSRSRARGYPGQFRTHVWTSADALWEKNPYLTPLSEGHAGVEVLDMQYPLIHQSWALVSVWTAAIFAALDLSVVFVRFHLLSHCRLHRRDEKRREIKSGENRRNPDPSQTAQLQNPRFGRRPEYYAVLQVLSKTQYS
jgi:hypothetical protein